MHMHARARTHARTHTHIPPNRGSNMERLYYDTASERDLLLDKVAELTDVIDRANTR